MYFDTLWYFILGLFKGDFLFSWYSLQWLYCLSPAFVLKLIMSLLYFEYIEKNNIHLSKKLCLKQDFIKKKWNILCIGKEPKDKSSKNRDTHCVWYFFVFKSFLIQEKLICWWNVNPKELEFLEVARTEKWHDPISPYLKKYLSGLSIYLRNLINFG